MARQRAEVLKSLWLTYKAILPNTAGATQIIETRRAFYAGADALFRSLLVSLDEDHEPTEADLMKMDDIDAELRQFAVDIRNGVA